MSCLAVRLFFCSSSFSFLLFFPFFLFSIFVSAMMASLITSFVVSVVLNIALFAPLRPGRVRLSVSVVSVAFAWLATPPLHHRIVID